jgi:hypothetical protein
LELVPGLTCSPTWHAVEVWTDLYSEAKGCACTGTIGPQLHTWGESRVSFT